MDRGASRNVLPQKMDKKRIMAREKPHNMGNPYGEPQPSAAPRPPLEDLDGYVLDGWDE